MRCKACGKELLPGVKFCNSCGAAVTIDPVPQANSSNQEDDAIPSDFDFLEAQLAEQPPSVGKTLRPFIKLDKFLTTKVFPNKKRTAMILGGYFGITILAMFIPPLIWLAVPLWILIPSALPLYIPILMLKLYTATARRIRDAAEAYPEIFNHFGVIDTPIAPLLSDTLIIRFIWRALPSQLRERQPIIHLSQNLALPCEVATTSLLVGKKAKRVWGCTSAEYGAMYQTVLQSAQVMSSQLGLETKQSYQALIKYIGKPIKVIKKGPKTLWQGNLADPQPTEQKFTALLE
ncbi:MAG: zinc ribbon domain-containing protein, partial [Clostridiales bacterium]|nr:zinc ribbon domain-containing protein [Clostridiales bacterium]